MVRPALAAREWGRLTAMFAFVLAVNAAGWGIFILCVMPHHFAYRGEGGSRGLGVGLGVRVRLGRGYDKITWLLGFRANAPE